MGESKQALAIDALLAAGETMHASVTCRPPGAIERQQNGQVKLVLTDRRLIGVRLGALLGRNLKATVLDVPLSEIAGVETRKRHPVATFGIPIFQVAVELRNGDTIGFENSGFGVKRGRSFASALLEATKETSTDQSIRRPSPEDPSGA